MRNCASISPSTFTFYDQYLKRSDQTRLQNKEKQTLKNKKEIKNTQKQLQKIEELFCLKGDVFLSQEASESQKCQMCFCGKKRKRGKKQ